MLRHLRKERRSWKMATSFITPPMSPMTRAGNYSCRRSKTRAVIWTRFSIAALTPSTELPSSLPEEFYFYLLATFHEGMHAEALAYTRQTLGYLRTAFRNQPDSSERFVAAPFPGDAEVPGGTFLIGATPDFPFVFDNEKWAHPVEIKPFRIARAPVTNGEFLAFVEDGGYRKAQFWSEPRLAMVRRRRRPLTWNVRLPSFLTRTSANRWEQPQF